MYVSCPINNCINATIPYSEIDFSDKNKNYYLIFGKESTGIPKEILHNNLDKCYSCLLYTSTSL